nr:NAD(P)-dependent oxidoreductase [Microbacterium rhizomatis]
MVTGSSGLIGSAIAQHLSSDGDVRLRRLVRDGRSCAAGDVCGDLRDAVSVRRAMDGVDVLVHAASYTGPDPALAWGVNETGTRVLVDAAHAAGVRRIVSISTAAVYGPGPHLNVVEGRLSSNPVSEVSRSRLAGETHVREAGGYVLRPNFVSGARDRAFIPGLVALFASLGAWVDNGAAHISTIDSCDLARLTAAFALGPAITGPRIVHVNHPQPISIRYLLNAIEQRFRVPAPERSITCEEAFAIASRPEFPFTKRQVSLVTLDHTYDSMRAWRATGLVPTAPFPIRAESSSWYGATLGQYAPGLADWHGSRQVSYESMG